MNPLPRTALRAARASRQQLTQQTRRHAHDASHAHAEPVKESFGRGFYLGLAGIPAVYFIYNSSQSTDGEPTYLTQVIEKFSEDREKLAERNDRHTQLVEDAAAQRHLFYGSKGGSEIDLKFPEIFNVGSPYNVRAGHYANIDKLIEKYEKENYEDQAKKLQELKEGTLKAEQKAEPVSLKKVTF